MLAWTSYRILVISLALSVAVALELILSFAHAATSGFIRDVVVSLVNLCLTPITCAVGVVAWLVQSMAVQCPLSKLANV